MPSASVRRATAVKPGFLRSIRAPYLRSCQSTLTVASFRATPWRLSARDVPSISRQAALVAGRSCPVPGQTIPRARWLGRLAERQPQLGCGAATAAAVFEREVAAVCLRDLPAQHQPDAGAGRFRREEWDEQIGRIGKPRPVVADDDLEPRSESTPADFDAAAGDDRRVHRVANEVDQELVELRAVRANRELGAGC